MILSKMGIKMSKDDGESLKKSVEETKQALSDISAATPKDGTAVEQAPVVEDVYMGGGGV